MPTGCKSVYLDDDDDDTTSNTDQPLLPKRIQAHCGQKRPSPAGDLKGCAEDAEAYEVRHGVATVTGPGSAKASRMGMRMGVGDGFTIRLYPGGARRERVE